MQLVLSWPIRLAVLAILLFSLFVDGAGYVYRIANHLPLAGNVQGLPPNFGGWQLFFHRGLDLAGGTHIDYELTNFPAGQSRPDVQQRTIAVINKRVNALGVNDDKVTNGPEPGYKPALTGLTGDDISSATATIDPTGTSWVVNITFTSSGASKFDQLTRDNVAACPGDTATSQTANCPQRHLAIWLDLTQKDLDSWEDSSYVAKVSSPYDSD